MHDPFQTYQQSGSPLGTSPYGIPYATNPYAAGLQNPLLQYALWQQALIQQNPLLAQNPFIAQNPLLHGIGQQQQHPQFGFTPAPQSLIGAGQFGQGQFGQGLPGANPFAMQGYGQQIHPLLLQQLALRSLTTPGITPWSGF